MAEAAFADRRASKARREEGGKAADYASLIRPTPAPETPRNERGRGSMTGVVETGVKTLVGGVLGGVGRAVFPQYRG